MEKHTITLTLPEKLYEQVRQLAVQSNRPIEELLEDGIALAFGSDADSLVDSLDSATDDQLWSVVNQTFAALNKMRIEHDDDNRSEVLDRYHAYVLARSEALALLKQRGHDIDSYLKVVGAYLQLNP